MILPSFHWAKHIGWHEGNSSTHFVGGTSATQTTFPSCYISFIMDQSTNKTTNEWLLQVACGKTCPTLGALLFAWKEKTNKQTNKNKKVGCTKSKDRILLADLVCFVVQCLPRSAHLNFFLILAFWWRRFKSAYPFLTTIFFLHQLPLVCLLLCFLLLLLLSIFVAPDADNFLSKALVFPCVSSYRWIHFPSSVLSVLSTSPVVVHSFLRKRTFSFIFIK